MSDYKMITDYIYYNNYQNHISTIVEFGSRDGLDAIFLAESFPKARIVTFECNPRQIPICISNIEKYESKDRIKFINKGVGNEYQSSKFYFYPDNVGASSLFIHKDESNKDDYDYVEIVRPDDILKQLKINQVDLLCMDIQGYEPFALLGLGEFLKNIKFIQTEMYTGNDTSYFDSPKREETLNVLADFNLVQESSFGIESNTIFKNKNVN